ncbi:hypothetical protein WJX73_010121 [Symbiochloris irregularis]|uniref:Uncharacterized protein n=1 Tax=Symbiochloris irregularis TaxID=706552 RepID=A0AAW1NT93_9CHLO
MLSKLHPTDLGRLACTCKAGSALVSLASDEIWRAAAAHVLPLRHPVRNSSQVPAIRVALTNFASSRANLRQGAVKRQQHISRATAMPAFAPNGRDFAVEIETSVPGSQAPEEPPRTSVKWRIDVFLEGGPSRSLLERPKPHDNFLDWAWSRDGQSIVCAAFPTCKHGGVLPCVRIEVANVHSSSSTEVVIALSDVADDPAVHFMSIEMSAYGECVAVMLDRTVDQHALIFSSAGDFLTSAPGDDWDHKPARSCLPVWHPQEPKVAFFAEGVLWVQDVITNQLSLVADLAGSYWEFKGCQVDCWSACGALLCFHTWVDEVNGHGNLTVVQSDGKGDRMLYNSHYHNFSRAALSDASTALFSVWTVRKLQDSGDFRTEMSVYDLAAASPSAVIFSRDMTFVEPVDCLPRRHTTFLFEDFD